MSFVSTITAVPFEMACWISSPVMEIVLSCRVSGLDEWLAMITSVSGSALDEVLPQLIGSVCGAGTGSYWFSLTAATGIDPVAPGSCEGSSLETGACTLVDHGTS